MLYFIIKYKIAIAYDNCQNYIFLQVIKKEIKFDITYEKI